MKFPAAIRRLARRIAGPGRRAPVTGQRKFEGGIHDRLTSSWTSSNVSINSEIYNSLETLRARSRDLYNNNEYARHFFGMLVTNTVGPDGVGYQSLARRQDGRLDESDNERLEMRMRNWSMAGNCDASRRLSRAAMERQFVLQLARDGEVLARKLPGFSNDYGYALQFIDTDLLDLHHNVDAGRGQNRIVMGVEVDEYDAPVAYHLLTRHPKPFAQTVALNSNERTRIPADQIIHSFITLRPGQVRGVPWIHAGMRGLRDLGGYREAAVIASRVGASKMGFWTSPDGMGAPYDGMDSAGNLVDNAEPGRFQQLPEGVSLEAWDPTYPHDQFDAFNKAMLRGLAGAFGVAYFTLNNDLEGVNLSSARIGLQNERDFYKTVQNLMVDTFHRDWFPEWLSMQLMLIPELPMSRFEKFNAAAWLPRTWASPDPIKDAQTASLLIGMNLTSPQRVIRERGHDPDEVLREIEQWNARLDELGIPAARPSQVQVDSDEPTQEEQAPAADADAEDEQARHAPLH